MVSVLDFGCAISNIIAPDRKKKLTDVCLGYDSVAGKITTRVIFVTLNIYFLFIFYVSLK